MEEDDFGDLYGDQAPVVSSIGAGSLQKTGYAFYDDDDDEGFGVIPAVHSHPPHVPSNPHGSVKLSQAQVHPYQPAERDSDEDDDMLLLGYNCKSSLASSKTQVPMVVTNKVQAAELDNLQEGFSGLAEPARVQNITENGAISPSACASRDVTAYVLGDTPKEDTRLGAHNPLDDPNGSPDVGDLTNHTLTIPGLSTTMHAPLFDLGDNGDVADDVWEQRQGGKTHLGTDMDVAAEGAADWDTDSEDDLQIVLNTEYPYYQTGDKVRVRAYEGGSEDEDDEDLIIVAGGNPLDEGEEQSFQPIDVLATPGDGSIHPAGDKQAGIGDEKGQQDKVVSGVAALSQSVSRAGYGYHNYNSPYKYVRPGAAPLYGTGVGPAAGQALGNRVSFLKGVNGRGDLRGFGRGSFGPQAASQLPLWATQSGYEYTLPPSMTVFDIDLEAFDEKPWRQPAIDVTDFFNFGFEETTWKYYCKQLAQLRIESTMQSKIRVYESGRSEQEYDPDLPPELAVAAGLHEVGDRNQHRLVESEATASAMGRRGYTPMIPLGRPIQVEGGLGDRRPSSDLRKQRIRDSDRIILIDAMEEEESEAQRLQDENIGGTADETEKEEELEEEEEEEEEQEVVDVRNTFKGRPQQHTWHEERVFDSKNHMPKGANTLPMESSQKFSERRFRTGFDAASVSTVGNMQEHPLASKSVVATELGKFSGESFSATHRETSSRPRTASKLLEWERRDWDQIHSQSGGLCQDAESNPKSLNDDGESHAKKRTGKEQQIQSQDGSHVGDDTSPGKFQTDHSTGQGVNGLVTTSSGFLIQGNIPEEVQGESPGCSSKRQRLVSPEGSHTASWDNYDPQKSTRSVAPKKESRDSGDSARDGQEDGSQYRKKHKSYVDMSRGQHKDSREGSDSYHMKQASILSKHELEKEIHSHVDNSQETGRRSKQGNMERDTVKELSSHWKDREENAYAQGKKREEEAGRREYLVKEAVHYKEKAGNRPELRKKNEEEREAAYHRDRGGNRPESRKREEEDRRGRHDSRKRDEEDRRDRLDIGYQHREKEVESLNWRSSERRKREEEYRRRDWSKEGGGHDKKEKEKHISERPDRELDQLSRRKEEESWKRERLEDHRRSKARDGSSRVKEDSRHRNGEYQDPHGRAHKDEERTAQAERSSRRHDEDRSWRGRDESHVSESTRSSEPRIFSKDRREDLDDYGINKIRSQEGRARSISDREGLHLLESSDRDSGKHNRLSDDPRTSERRLHSDKHRSDAKRRKESDKETNKSASQLGDYSDASRKRKAASDKMEMAIRKQVEDSMISRTKGSQDFVTRIHPEETKDFVTRIHPEETKEEFNESNSGKLDNKVRNSPVTEKWSSEDDEQQKGRTKLERWTSHKDLEFLAFEKLPFHDNAKKDERHRQSSVSQEKQRHDPSKPHDDLNKENQQLAGIDSMARKASVFEEQVNGKVLEPEQKGGSVVQSKESHAHTEDKNYIELPEHHQHDPVLRRTDMAAKLEKRKERFKVPVEDKELLRNLDSEDHQMTDKELSRQERPPRKRRWASG